MTALTRLRLTDFRNYNQFDLRLDARHVCLYGPNGAGKTNLLEAISQLAPGRGLRSAAIGELNRHGASGNWRVAAELDGQRIGVGLERAGAGAKRILRLDGETVAATEIAERLRILWLTPAMDGVFRGGASDRRRFFDRQVMTHIPDHGPAAARYERAMRERNALLARERYEPAWLEAIEARMAEAGAEMAAYRVSVLGHLQGVIAARRDSAFPKAELALDGPFERGVHEGAPPADIATQIARALFDGRSRDRVAGRTLSGPHRSDLLVTHAPTGLPARDASTGQQKALLVGLILASAQALLETGKTQAPILLLDEAAAHLDADRRAALFDELDALGSQSWLTGTESFLFEAFGPRAQHVRLQDGGAHWEA